MHQELSESAYQRLWRRLQQIGLNAYEARTYVALVGHPRMKALDLAVRADVPRQKIYEVLDELAEKGFVQTVQEKTKVFFSVEPGLAIPNFLARRHASIEQEWTEHSRLASGLVDDLESVFSGQGAGRGTLNFLRIATDPAQTAEQYRRMIRSAGLEYLEFSRPPFAVDPLDERLVKEACARGVSCRLIIETSHLNAAERRCIQDYRAAGVQIRMRESLPMKLAVFDGERGMIALLDPIVSKPTWTALLFDHPGMAEAMKGLFDAYWSQAGEF